MILFSSILLQETKELESVKDFLLASNEKTAIELFNLKDQYEDLLLEKNSEKKVFSFNFLKKINFNLSLKNSYP